MEWSLESDRVVSNPSRLLLISLSLKERVYAYYIIVENSVFKVLYGPSWKFISLFAIVGYWLAVFNMGRCKLGRQNVYKYHSLPFVLLLQKLLSISSLNFKWCKTTVIPHSIHVLSILLMLDSMMM